MGTGGVGGLQGWRREPGEAGQVPEDAEATKQAAWDTAIEDSCSAYGGQVPRGGLVFCGII